jgi:KipI family sensor histidine kinase inhibitor
VSSVELMGDTAVLARAGSVTAARRLATALESAAWPGVEEVVAGAESVLLVADPARVDVGELLGEVERIAATASAGETAVAGPHGTATRHDIPVAFDGPDLEAVAKSAGWSVERCVAALAQAELAVAFVGFTPGFAYLSGLPAELAAIERLATPRPRVERGAVGIGGGFAGIYPLATPGGWRLLGRTGYQLLDPTMAPYARLRAGDSVRLHPSTQPDLAAPADRPPLRAAGARRALVEEAGPQSTVQDLGRLGVAAAGIPPAGAADSLSLRLANAAVGNDAGWAGVEVTAGRLALRFEAPATVALAGHAPLLIDGREMPAGAVQPVGAGQLLTVGPLRAGARAYLAVAGGFEPDRLFGSRSSDTMSGLGTGALRRGDELAIGTPGRPRGRFAVLTPYGSQALRVMAGAAGLAGGGFVVRSDSSRAGIRLSGAAGAGSGRVPSQGVVAGAVQLTPGGEPIVLGVDHGTLGGYPVLATVISADVPLLGQLLPGDEVRFSLVDLSEAGAARRARERQLADAVSGWYPI